MWLFGIPRNYMDMIEKISKCVYTTSLFLLFILSNIDQGFKDFMTKLSMGAKIDVFGIELSMALFYLPLIASLSEHIFQIHDRLSDLLRIRKAYDKDIIARNILEKVDMHDRKMCLDDDETDVIMGRVFYKYASSTDPKIDPHIIYLTLNKWCWFWVLLDLTILFLLIGIAFLCAKWSVLSLFLLEITVIFMFLLMCVLLKQIILCTKEEINEIFSDNERKELIRGDLENALFD